MTDSESIDAEIAAIRDIAAALEKILDSDSRYRALSWAWARYITDPSIANLKEKGIAPLSPFVRLPHEGRP